MQNYSSFDRYSRQIFIEEIGIEGQRKILSSKILVIGLGGLGSPIVQYLAAAGVEYLGIVDYDIVEIHNLNRQTIHTEKSVKENKVQSAYRYIKGLNSTIQIIPINLCIEHDNVDQVIEPYDIIVDGSDNFKTRYLVNDSCVRLNKPLVYGSIFSFEGQMAVFNHHGSKNLRDLFPEPPNPEDFPNCDKNGVLGPLPGIIGSMMAMQVLKIITNLPVDSNQLTVVNTLNWKFNVLHF